LTSSTHQFHVKSQLPPPKKASGRNHLHRANPDAGTHYQRLSSSTQRACGEHSLLALGKVWLSQKHSGAMSPHDIVTCWPLADLHPAVNYRLFNSSNVSACLWSWNYRGCWHQTCPPVDTHRVVWIPSIPSPTCHMGTWDCYDSLLPLRAQPWHWASCTPAARLGSGSHLSGSLSRIEP